MACFGKKNVPALVHFVSPDILSFCATNKSDSWSYHNPYMPEQSATVQKLRCLKDDWKGVDVAAFLERLLMPETKRHENARLWAETQFLCEDLAVGVMIIP